MSETEAINKVKLQICYALKRVALKRYWTQKRMAEFLCTSPSCVSHVIRQRTDKLTLNQLFEYLAKVEPYFEILISI